MVLIESGESQAVLALLLAWPPTRLAGWFTSPPEERRGETPVEGR